MTQAEVDAARRLVQRYGPPNAWTAANGALAAALGRALLEIERLKATMATKHDQRGET